MSATSTSFESQQTIPWRGELYDEHRLLLLGESAYSWVEEGEIAHPSPRHAADSVENMLDGGKVGRFMTMVTCGLAGCENPTAEQSAAAWKKVAFFNYVTSTVGVGAGVRPSQEQWDQAALAFPGMLRALQPRTVVVLGKQMWGHMPEPGVWLTDDVQAYELPDGGAAVCWAVQHPAAGLSWRRLQQVIAFAQERRLVFEPVTDVF